MVPTAAMNRRSTSASRRASAVSGDEVVSVMLLLSSGGTHATFPRWCGRRKRRAMWHAGAPRGVRGRLRRPRPRHGGVGPALPADVELAGAERGELRGRRIRAAAHHPARSRAVVPGEHAPLRVSGIQSGVFSGAVGRRPGSSRSATASGARAPADPVGVDARVRAPRGAGADGPQPALDGRGVDGRARGGPRPLGRDLHLRDLRRRGAGRRRRRERCGRDRRAPVPRPGDQRRVRRAAGGARPRRAPRLRRRLAARAGGLPHRRGAREDRPPGARTTRCR